MRFESGRWVLSPQVAALFATIRGRCGGKGREEASRAAYPQCNRGAWEAAVGVRERVRWSSAERAASPTSDPVAGLAEFARGGGFDREQA